MVRYYFNAKTGNKYKTGGQYKDLWVLLPFGWIISTQFFVSDLGNGDFEEVDWL